MRAGEGGEDSGKRKRVLEMALLSKQLLSSIKAVMQLSIFFTTSTLGSRW